MEENNKDSLNIQKNDLNEINNTSFLNSRTVSMKSCANMSNKNVICSNKNIQKNNNNNNNNKTSNFVRNNYHENTNSTAWTYNTNSKLKSKIPNSSKKSKYNEQDSYSNSFYSNIFNSNNTNLTSEPIRLKNYPNSTKKSKNYSKRKIVPLVNELLTEGDEIKNEIKIKVKLLNDLNSSDITAYSKRHKKHINIEQIRKNYHLDNVKPVINEENILLNNAKKVGKTLNNKQKKFLLKVARTVIREDMLSNNLVDCDHSLLFKLNFLNERKKNKGKIFTEKKHKDTMKKKTEIEKLFKVIQHSLPNYCNLKSLENMIYKYRTLRFSPSKLVE